VPLLRQKRVTYSRPAELVVVLYVVPDGPVVKPLVQLSRLNIFGRLEVIRRNNYLFAVENLVDAMLLEHCYSRRSRNIVTHHNVNLRVYQLARLNTGLSSRLGKHFLRYRSRHTYTFFQYCTDSTTAITQ